MSCVGAVVFNRFGGEIIFQLLTSLTGFFCFLISLTGFFQLFNFFDRVLLEEFFASTVLVTVRLGSLNLVITITIMSFVIMSFPVMNFVIMSVMTIFPLAIVVLASPTKTRFSDPLSSCYSLQQQKSEDKAQIVTFLCNPFTFSSPCAGGF